MVKATLVPKTLTALIPAAAYYRMSSNKQEASIPAQRIAVERWAAENGYVIVAEFSDAGISGWKSEQREGFQRLIAAAQKGEFQAVLCWDMDRFSRFPVLEANHYWYLLDSAGVHISTVNQGRLRFDDLGEWLKASVTQHGKAEYIQDLARNTMRGRIESAKKGLWGYEPPYGFRKEGQRLFRGDELQVLTLCKMYKLYLSGLSLRGLADKLNSEGIPARRGGDWTRQSIHKVLQNRANVGDFVWNVVSAGKFNRTSDGKVMPKQGKGRQLNDEADWIVIEDNHEALIDRESFDRVQCRLKERSKKTTPHKNGGAYVLSGLLHCGHCGGRMHGSEKDQQFNYVCSTYYSKGRSKCKPYRVLQTPMVDQIITVIEQKFLDPTHLKRLKAAIRKELRESVQKTDTGKLKKELASVQTKLRKATRRLVEVDPDMVQAVQIQIRQIRDRERKILDILETAQTPQRRLVSEQDDLVDKAVEKLSQLRRASEGRNKTLLREMLHECIDSVELWFSHEKKGNRTLYPLESGELRFRSDVMSKLSTVG